MAYLTDGFKALIQFADYPTVKFKEVTVTPPSMIGGGENDFTNMRNEEFRTKNPKKLKSMGNMSFTAHYDPQVYDSGQVFEMINVNQLISVIFPDGSAASFWGWLDEFTPNEMTEGAPPTASGTIIASNLNASGEETAPVYFESSASGSPAS